MIRRAGRRGKDADGRFAESPWNQRSPPWKQIDARLPADHVARQISELVDQLDLSSLFGSYQGRGSKAHRPDLLLKMVLYEIQRGKPSPAEWHRDLQENEVVKWLVFGVQPCRAAVYEFRDRLADYWDQWNAQVLQMARQRGATIGKRAALDGSLMAALASRHKLVNQQTLHGRIEDLDKVVAADEQGAVTETTPVWMANHPESREQQRERYRHARTRMNELQELNKKRPSSKRKKPEKIVVSVGDPEAAIGRDKLKVFRPLYNTQLIYDLDCPMITAYDVYPWQNDAGTLEPMLERQSEMLGNQPEKLLADSGYAGGPDVAVCRQHGVTLYAPVSKNDFSQSKQAGKVPPRIPKSEFTWLVQQQTYACPEGHQLLPRKTAHNWHFGNRTTLQTTYYCPSKHCAACPRQSSCTNNSRAGRTVTRREHEDLIEALRQRMETPEAKQLYRLRRQTVELRYADMKEHRNLQRFTGRGLRRAKAQVAATVLAHNLLALARIEFPETKAPLPGGIPEKIPP